MKPLCTARMAMMVVCCRSCHPLHPLFFLCVCAAILHVQCAQVPASNNTLNLVLHDPGTHKFVKYVASNAPGSRWDVAAEYEVSPEDVGGGSDEGDEGDEGDE